MDHDLTQLELPAKVTALLELQGQEKELEIQLQKLQTQQVELQAQLRKKEERIDQLRALIIAEVGGPPKEVKKIVITIKDEEVEHALVEAPSDCITTRHPSPVAGADTVDIASARDSKQNPAHAPRLHVGLNQDTEVIDFEAQRQEADDSVLQQESFQGDCIIDLSRPLSPTDDTDDLQTERGSAVRFYDGVYAKRNEKHRDRKRYM